MPPHARRGSALLALLSLLAGLPQGALAVCVAEDGHVALGMRGASRPAEAVPTSEDRSLRDAPCACGDGCGPCRDAEVGFATAPLTGARGPGLQAPVPLTTSAFASSIPPAAAALRRAAHPGRSPSFGPEHALGVVLRI